MSRSRVLLIAVTALFQGLAFAQDSRPESAPTSAPAKAAEKGAWDVSNPPGNRRAFDLETSEGTWMSLDVSPDGKDIVFDLLGDLWTMPITGGDATLLRGGIPFETQPRYSKDGRFIAFTSDAGGGDNIWIMDRDGKNARQLTKENYRLVNNARWMPSGDFIVAKKHFSSHRSLGSGEMWMYRVGGGDGMQLTTKRTEQKDVGEPEISPDGRYVYFSEDTTPGGEFEYNKNPHETIYSIRRLDLTTGELKTVLDLTGGAVRPTISPDGKRLAFVHRMRLQSVLAIYDIEKGTWRDIYDQLDHDQQETWAIFGVYPSFAWTPDGRSIVIWAKGGLQKIDVATMSVAPIPFKAAVHLDLTETVRSPQTVSSPEFDVKVIRRPEISPDGRWVLFSALGHTYIKKLPDGSPVRVTDQTAFEFQPTFAPDSVSLVHVTWDDRRGGALEFVFIDENRERRTITTEPGHYVEPVFSPDGKKVAFRRTNGDGLRGVDRTAKAGIYVLDLATGETRFVTANGTDPHFSADQKALYLTRGAGDGARLVRYALDGTDPIETPIAQSGMATEILLSPDEKWIAWVEGFQVYVAPFVRTGRELGLAPAMGQLPVKKCSEIGGEFLSFSADSSRLRFSLGAKLTEVEPAKLIGPLAMTEAPKDQPKPNVIDLSFRARTDVPESVIVFDHATVLTMRKKEIIADGKIVVRGDKIAAVGKSADVETPAGAIVRDLGGMIVAPGFVDVHSHMGRASEGVSPQSSWALLANLAFGVTTVHDPSADTKSVFAESELVKAGLLQGPRVFSTGTILYGAEGNFKAVINSIDDARAHLKRLREWGAFSVKSYNQPRREQRQQVIAAARELSMEVVPEGGSTFFWNLTHIIDGHTTVEHALPIAPLYEDAVQLFARSGTGYTPTLIVGYGGLWGENYWYAHTPVWENARLMNFVPRSIVDAKSIRRPIAPEEDYNHFRLARTAKRIKDAGGLVELGAHGQIQGLGAHWELWMFAQGGMNPMEALESASLDGARALGLDQEIGSIEAGKLADLIFWPGAKSPLENIRNSDSLQWVMKGGRLYDAMSLDQILPEAKPRRPGPAIELLGRENLVGGGCTCEGHSH